MTKTLFKVCIAFGTFAAAAQAQQFSSKYFDCWMENVAHVDASEIQRLGIKTYGDSWICGCFNVEDTDGEDWQEGEVLTKVNKVWDLPQYEILPCRAKDCSDTSETYAKSLDLCVDHLNNSGFTLADFKEGGKVPGLKVTLTTKGLTREGWELKQKSIRKIVSFKSKKYPKATPDVLIVGYWK